MLEVEIHYGTTLVAFYRQQYRLSNVRVDIIARRYALVVVVIDRYRNRSKDLNLKSSIKITATTTD